MRYVVSLIPIVAVILFNTVFAIFYNIGAPETSFLVWCFISGFCAGWIGAEIYLGW